MSKEKKNAEKKPALWKLCAETCHEQAHELNYMFYCQHDDSQQPHPANVETHQKEHLAYNLPVSKARRFFHLLSTEVLNYLGINNKDLSSWDSNLKIADFISVSVPKTSIEWVAIRRKQCLDILDLKRITNI